MKKISIAVFLFITACNSSKQLSQTSSFPQQNIVVKGKIFASLFMQRAAEYRALCLQAFNIARLRVDESLQTISAKPKAIITDIDETILDNSAYEVHQTLQGKDYESPTWYQWTDMSAADTIPGGAAFLKYAASQGIEIFYVTNREEREKKSTLINLQKFNFPNADMDHLLVRQTTSSKEARRQQVAATHNIILLMGDNLADLSNFFDKKTTDERLQNTDKLSGEFGKKFIVLPNSTYGDWESALYKYNYALTRSQKDSVVKSMLKGY